MVLGYATLVVLVVKQIDARTGVQKLVGISLILSPGYGRYLEMEVGRWVDRYLGR